MSKRYELEGQVFGKLTVVGKAERPAGITGKRTYWQCRCECGGNRAVSTTDLRTGKVTHCGCDMFGALASDMIGERFGLLVVEALEASGGGSRAGRRYLCRCDCGATRVSSAGHLRAGYVKGCADCAKRERYARSVATRTASGDRLAGTRFGSFEVLPEGVPGRRLCRCLECGNELQVPLRLLSSGKWRGKCRGEGCPTRPVRPAPRESMARFIGRKFNRLTITGLFRGPDGCTWAYADCECGTRGYRVPVQSLRSGNTKGCGCLKWVVPERMKGPNHPWYNPELTDEERRAGRKFEGLDAFRGTVFRRDDYTCQACGQRGGKLAAHHIKPFKYFENHRESRRNGVTLCKEHHVDFHRMFGYDNKDNWREFTPWLRAVRKETGYKHG